VAGRFRILTDEHPGVIMAVQRHSITPGRLVRFLETLAAEDDPFAGVVRFVTPSD